MNGNERELDLLAESIIGAAYEVSNLLGAGFLEKLCERALIKELGLRGLRVERQFAFAVAYKGEPIGEYFADLVVEGKIVVELKCVDCFAKEHLAQCINYLKASGITLALLINFQRPKVEWKRVVYRF
jgi:GxxExxY protein